MVSGLANTKGFVKDLQKLNVEKKGARDARREKSEEALWFTTH